MNVIVIGAGNSGLAAAAHLSKEGDTVVLWNRSRETIAGLLTSGKIVLHGAIEGEYTIPLITDDLEEALGFFEPQVILVTTPATSHEAGRTAGQTLQARVWCSQSGRTFGALDFCVFRKYNRPVRPRLPKPRPRSTCQKTAQDAVHHCSGEHPYFDTKSGEPGNPHARRLQSYFVPPSP